MDSAGPLRRQRRGEATSATDVVWWPCADCFAQEVCDEVAGKDRKCDGLKRWTRLTRSRHVQILPALQAKSWTDPLRRRWELWVKLAQAGGARYRTWSRDRATAERYRAGPGAQPQCDTVAHTWPPSLARAGST